MYYLDKIKKNINKEEKSQKKKKINQDGKKIKKKKI